MILDTSCLLRADGVRVGMGDIVGAAEADRRAKGEGKELNRTQYLLFDSLNNRFTWGAIQKVMPDLAIRTLVQLTLRRERTEQEPSPPEESFLLTTGQWLLVSQRKIRTTTLAGSLKRMSMMDPTLRVKVVLFERKGDGDNPPPTQWRFWMGDAEVMKVEERPMDLVDEMDAMGRTVRVPKYRGWGLGCTSMGLVSADGLLVR